MPLLTIDPRLVDAKPGAFRVEYDLARSDTGEHQLLFYEFTGPACSPPRVADGAIAAILFHAMRNRLDVHVRGTVTRDAILNLTELQHAWRSWRPDEYAVVALGADHIAERGDPNGPVVCAFSGGVDSTFTVLRHTTQDPATSRGVSAALLVQGFDVALDNDASMQACIARSRPFLEQRGLAIHTVRTNSKALALQGWEDSFGAQLAGCLHGLSARFRFGLVGSTKSYDDLAIPWGSSPITDHLLSGSELEVVHDAAGFTRTAKIAAIAADPLAVRGLRVCWEGDRSLSRADRTRGQGRNCGVCEKCVRTRLCFLAVGVSDPPCFDTPWDSSSLASLRIKHELVLGELRSVLDHAEAHGIRERWTRDLRARVKRGVTRSHKRRLKAAWRRLGLWTGAAHTT
jgi:hypothetical protein